MPKKAIYHFDFGKLEHIEHALLMAKTRELLNPIDKNLANALLRTVEVAQYVEALLQDGMDCPFCAFQQDHENGHEEHCPMRYFPEARYKEGGTR